MTEQTLEKAMGIKHMLDRTCIKKKELEKAKKLCYGNTRDVGKRFFKIQISEGSSYKEIVSISLETARMALDKEIENVDRIILDLRDELSELC